MKAFPKNRVFFNISLYITSIITDLFFQKKRDIKKEDIKKYIIEEAAHSYIAFVNGHIDLSLSDISMIDSFIDIEKKGVVDEIKERDYNFFMSLNGALAPEEIHISILENRSLKKPLQILNVITEDIDDYSLLSPRIYFNFNKFSESSVYLTGCNLSIDRCYWVNQGIYLNIDSEAKVDLFSCDKNGKSSYLFNMIRAKLKKHSALNVYMQMEGTQIEHNDLQISLIGEGARCNVNGLFLLRENQQSHININVDHMAEHTLSNQIVKGVLKDAALSSFEATVYIDKKAIKANSAQLNKNLILSDKARAFCKPFLKVFTDDVKATHGATIYRLHDEDLFYLMSRGIEEEEAKYLLIKGFCQEIINPVNIQSIRDMLKDRLICYLG